MIPLPAGTQIFRFVVPIDDQWHELPATGPVLHVAARRFDAIEFWALAPGPDGPPAGRRFRVVGTGQPIPSDATYHGTALAGGLVWHLVEEGHYAHKIPAVAG